MFLWVPGEEQNSNYCANPGLFFVFFVSLFNSAMQQLCANLSQAGSSVCGAPQVSASVTDCLPGPQHFTGATSGNYFPGWQKSWRTRVSVLLFVSPSKTASIHSFSHRWCFWSSECVAMLFVIGWNPSLLRAHKTQLRASRRKPLEMWVPGFPRWCKAEALCWLQNCTLVSTQWGLSLCCWIFCQQLPVKAK